MPLSRLENFLVNTDGNRLYVNPSDLDATDSFDNKGNSLTWPFVTISKSGGSDAGTFQPSKNGVTQGGTDDQITTTTGSGTVTKSNSGYTSLMDFAAGDRINYVTIDATDTTTCLTMLVRFNP